jgi:hypothetical protein
MLHSHVIRVLLSHIDAGRRSGPFPSALFCIVDHPNAVIFAKFPHPPVAYALADANILLCASSETLSICGIP